jgi:ZIP family zinc transporter
LDYLVLFLAGSATALATGLGAIPVFWLGTESKRLEPALWGFAGGTMAFASLVGLILPALDEGTALGVGAGLALGVAFMVLTRHRLDAHEVRVMGMGGRGVRTSVLVFAVLFVHSAPEGMAIGSAYASDTAGLSLFVILAIAIQNIPEGTSVAIPMAAAGFTRGQQFWAAVGTSVPQPIAAVIAFALVEVVDSLLPVSFAFAAGAMLALVALELLPQAFAGPGRLGAAAGVAAGAALMLALSAVLAV